MVTETSPATER